MTGLVLKDSGGFHLSMKSYFSVCFTQQPETTELPTCNDLKQLKETQTKQMIIANTAFLQFDSADLWCLTADGRKFFWVCVLL